MDNFYIKLRRIFLPYILIAVGCVVGYNLLFWYIIIKKEAFSVDEMVANFWGPAVLPWIPLLLWLRPRLRLLNLRNKKGSYLGGYIYFFGLPIAIATIIANSYTIKITGELTPVNYISQITPLKKTKYYKAKEYYADKTLASVQSTFKITGKYSSDFDMSIYFVCPLFDKNMDTAKMPPPVVVAGSRQPPPLTSFKNILFVVNGIIVSQDSVYKINPNNIQSLTVLKGKPAKALYGDAAANGVLLVKMKDAGQMQPFDKNKWQTPVAWVGVKYFKTISNHNNSQDEKNRKYHNFFTSSYTEFKNTTLQNATYFDRIGLSDEQKGYLAAVKKIYKNPLDKPVIVFVEHTDAFADRTGNDLAWIFGILAIGAVIFWFAIATKSFADEAVIV